MFPGWADEFHLSYGRHSKSINPDECCKRANGLRFASVTHMPLPTVCGACKTGKLIPLFATRTPQKSKNTSSGKMATTQPRGMSCTAPRMLA